MAEPLEALGLKVCNSSSGLKFKDAFGSTGTVTVS